MKKLGMFLCVVTLVLFAAPSFAYIVTVNYNAGTTQITDALTGFTTTGAMMDGMDVTAWFSDKTYQSLSWADTGSVSGGVGGVGFNWSLTESGDTFGGFWSLTNTSGLSINHIFIDAGTGDSVFDTNFGGVYGTDGSALGWSFEVQAATSDLNIVATYIDTVALTGAAPVGDLYRFLDIQFINNGGFAANDTLSFIADTDNLKFAGDIHPIPEPGTVLLLGTGLIGLVALGRKKFLKK